MVLVATRDVEMTGAKELISPGIGLVLDILYSIGSAGRELIGLPAAPVNELTDVVIAISCASDSQA